MGESTDTLTRDIEQTRQNLSRDVDELADKVSPSRIVHRQKEAASSRLRGVKDKVMGATSSATSSVGSAGQSAGDSAAGALHSVEQQAAGSPLAAGLVAFGIGAVVASLLPATEAEAQVTQRAVDTAKEQGQPLLDQAKSAGQEIASDLKESATQSAQDLKETAQESAQNVKDEAQSAGEKVKDSAPGT